MSPTACLRQSACASRLASARVACSVAGLSSFLGVACFHLGCAGGLWHDAGSAQEANAQVCLDAMTVWPSGLRRWLQAPVRKGVGSNPTAVIYGVL